MIPNFGSKEMKLGFTRFTNRQMEDLSKYIIIIIYEAFSYYHLSIMLETRYHLFLSHLIILLFEYQSDLNRIPETNVS